MGDFWEITVVGPRGRCVSCGAPARLRRIDIRPKGSREVQSRTLAQCYQCAKRLVEIELTHEVKDARPGGGWGLMFAPRLSDEFDKDSAYRGICDKWRNPRP
jgi:hypothetical protein